MPGAKLTDKELARLGRAYKKAQEAEADAKVRKAEVGAEIVAEMQARGTKGIDHAGVSVTLVEPESVVYDEIGILSSPKFRKFKRQLTEATLNKKELSRLVQAGQIKTDDVNEFATIQYKKAYPSVTVRSAR